jgi:hypothetical protein
MDLWAQNTRDEVLESVEGELEQPL